MTGLRLDGRTAIVTGAGGNPGMGRAHALLLGRLGANVVVNDVGAAAETPNYAWPADAEAVAQEIRNAGGSAVASTDSVATKEGGAAIVATALDTFGGIDILVNNAAFSITASFADLTAHDFERHIAVNLMGPVWICRAAWPHMTKQRYGRIVNITSGAIAGGGGVTAYAASKGGLYSFTRSLASEGDQFGIKANMVNPGAMSRLVMATQKEGSEIWEGMANQPAELISPVVAYLAHENCPVNGEVIETSAGQTNLVYLARTAGFSIPDLDIDTLAARWDEVVADADPAMIPWYGSEMLDGARPYDPSRRPQ